MPLRDPPCGLLTFDEQLLIVEVNEIAADLVGLRTDELLGRTVADLLSMAGRGFLITHLVPELALRGFVSEVYLPLRDAAGQSSPVLLNARRRTADDGRGLYDLAFLPMHRRHLVERELTAARRAAEDAVRGEEQARSRAKAFEEELALRDKLTLLGTLAAGVVHDLNNPLTFVVGSLEALGEAIAALPAGPARREVGALLEDTRDGVERVRGIVAGLRDLSRADSARRGPVDLERVVNASLRVAAHELRGRAAVTVEIEAPSPVVEADEGRIVQVLVNLVVNAAQALAGRPPQDCRIAVRARRQPDGNALVEVADNGPGLAPDVRDRLFEPFVSSRKHGSGTGLGLWVCRQIVTGYGGAIDAESRAGEGTTFRVTLPLSMTPVVALPPAAKKPPAPVACPAQPRVLIIDDDEAIVRILQRLLRNYQLTIALDGADAIERLLRGEHYELILSDLMMSGVTGMDIHAFISRSRPDLLSRLIFLSGGAFTETSRAFLQHSGVRCLAKPFTITDLRAECERALASDGPSLERTG